LSYSGLQPRAALSTQLSATNIQVRRMNATVLLIKALGGSWKRATNQTSARPE
jgi:hypothetical protein